MKRRIGAWLGRLRESVRAVGKAVGRWLGFQPAERPSNSRELTTDVSRVRTPSRRAARVTIDSHVGATTLPTTQEIENARAEARAVAAQLGQRGWGQPAPAPVVHAVAHANRRLWRRRAPRYPGLVFRAQLQRARAEAGAVAAQLGQRGWGQPAPAPVVHAVAHANRRLWRRRTPRYPGLVSRAQLQRARTRAVAAAQSAGRLRSAPQSASIKTTLGRVFLALEGRQNLGKQRPTQPPGEAQQDRAPQGGVRVAPESAAATGATTYAADARPPVGGGCDSDFFDLNPEARNALLTRVAAQVSQVAATTPGTARGVGPELLAAVNSACERAAARIAQRHLRHADSAAAPTELASSVRLPSELPKDYVPKAESRHALYQVQLGQFAGPLDLLLFLIRRHQIDIFDIPVAFICDRYLEHLRLMEALNIDVAAEFLFMASELLHLKSKMLLPEPEEVSADEEEGADPRAELVQRLLEYQKYRDAADHLDTRTWLGRETFSRPPETLPTVEGQTKPLKEVGVFALLKAFDAVLKRQKPEARHHVKLEAVSVRQRIVAMIELLIGQQAVRFVHFLEDAQRRIDIVVTFLAVLEMAKLRLVSIYQSETEELYLHPRFENAHTALGRLSALDDTLDAGAAAAQGQSKPSKG